MLAPLTECYHWQTKESELLGDLYLSYSWLGPGEDQLKIRIVKMKNIPEELHRAGLYIR